MPATFTISAIDQHGRKVEVTVTGHENQLSGGPKADAIEAFKAIAGSVGLGNALGTHDTDKPRST